MNIKNWVCGCLVIVLLCVSNLFATTLNVPGILYPTIQSAINAAVNGDTVLVQPGTYYETIDFLGKEITIVSSGGASVTTIDANQKDTVVYFWNNETSDSILDGFTLTNGIGYFEPFYEQRIGGAIFIYQSYPTIRNCTLVNNSTDSYGGAVYTDFAHIDTVSFENCTFANNESPRGGAIFAGRTNLVLTNCSLVNNTAQFGGAIESTESGTSITQLAMTNCLIDGNIATQGGGMRLSQKGVSQITNCVINNNEATIAGYAGGGCIIQSQHNFINCTFTNNNAVNGNGGAVSIASYAGASPSFTGCEFSNNIAQYGGAIYASNGCTSEITGCDIRDNFANTRGGGINVEGCPIIINACSIIGNWTALNINESWHEGGGIFLGGTPSPTIANSLIAGNTAVTGGGISSVNSDVVIANTTIYANKSLTRGGGVYARTKTGSAQFHNSIAWSNSDNIGSGESSQLFLNDNESLGEIDISYSIIEHWSGTMGGTSNSGSDPRWVSPLGDDGIAGTLDDDLHLHPTSPCIDAGSNAIAYGTTDIDGDPRFLNDPYTDDTGSGTPPIVDIGPDEFIVAIIGDGGARLWMDSGMPSCMFDDMSNWLPSEVPDLNNLAIFEVLGEASVCLGVDTTVEQLIVANGDVYIGLGGMTLTSLQEVLVAPYGGKIANLSVSGGFFGARNNHVEGTLVFDTLNVGGNGIGTFSIDENVNVIANEILMQFGTSMEGSPTIQSDMNNFGGKLRPGTSNFFDPLDLGMPGVIGIDGDYSQTGSPDADLLPRYGSMEFDIDPSNQGIPHDSLSVAGHATLGGVLELNFDTSYVDVGDTFDFFEAATVSGAFDFVWARGLQNGEVALVEDQFGLFGSVDDITIGQANEILFGSVGSVQLVNTSGQPTDFLVLDFDGKGGLDAIVTRMGPPLSGLGVVEIYYDIYSGSTEITTIQVGQNPRGIVAADFDSDDDIDLAVVNTDDDTMSILINNGITFAVNKVDVVHRPIDLAVGDFVSSEPLTDLAVASAVMNTIEVYENTASLLLVAFQFKNAIPVGSPDKIDPGDVNNDKDFILSSISSGDDTTFTVPGHGEGGVSPLHEPGSNATLRIPVGDNPLELAVADLNGDGVDDTVTINGDGTLSVRLDTSEVAATISLGAYPWGLVTGDMDNDGDQDIVVSAINPYNLTRELGEQGVLIIRNDSEDLSTISLTDQGYISAEGIAGPFIDLGDVNGDGLLDIVALTGEGGTATQIEFWLNAPQTAICLGDFDENGSVTVSDLLFLIAAWGEQGGEADLDQNGVVAVADLLMLIANWGQCSEGINN